LNDYSPGRMTDEEVAAAKVRFAQMKIS